MARQAAKTAMVTPTRLSIPRRFFSDTSINSCGSIRPLELSKDDNRPASVDSLPNCSCGIQTPKLDSSRRSIPPPADALGENERTRASGGRRLPRVPRLGGEPRVLDRHADRKVIQALKRMPAEPEHLVHRVVVEAADAGAACAGGFGGKIQPLADHACLPEQVAVEGRTELLQAGVELGNHAETEESV